MVPNLWCLQLHIEEGCFVVSFYEVAFLFQIQCPSTHLVRISAPHLGRCPAYNFKLKSAKRQEAYNTQKAISTLSSRVPMATLHRFMAVAGGTAP